MINWKWIKEYSNEKTETENDYFDKELGKAILLLKEEINKIKSIKEIHISDFEYWLWKNENKTVNKLFQQYLDSEV